jgi:hypothetical protein
MSLAENAPSKQTLSHFPQQFTSRESINPIRDEGTESPSPQVSEAHEALEQEQAQAQPELRERTIPLPTILSHPTTSAEEVQEFCQDAGMETWPHMPPTESMDTIMQDDDAVSPTLDNQHLTHSTPSPGVISATRLLQVSQSPPTSHLLPTTQENASPHPVHGQSYPLALASNQAVAINDMSLTIVPQNVAHSIPNVLSITPTGISSPHAPHGDAPPSTGNNTTLGNPSTPAPPPPPPPSSSSSDSIPYTHSQPTHTQSPLLSQGDYRASRRKMRCRICGRHRTRETNHFKGKPCPDKAKFERAPVVRPY